MEHLDALNFLLLVFMVVFNVARVESTETQLQQANDILLRCARRLDAAGNQSYRRRW